MDREGIVLAKHRRPALLSSRDLGFTIGEARVGPQASSFEVSWTV